MFAEEALNTGLVHRIVERENLDRYAYELALTLAQLPSEVAGGVRQAVNDALDIPLSEGLASEAEIAMRIVAEQ